VREIVAVWVEGALVGGSFFKSISVGACGIALWHEHQVISETLTKKDEHLLTLSCQILSFLILSFLTLSS